MFKIEGGGTRFYQWDTNRRIIVEDSKIEEVHFCNTTDDCSLVVKAYTENGERFANVPNVLLQDTWPIRVYAYESYTKHYAVFNIVARTKPADYVYTETEIRSWEAIEARMDQIEATVTLEGVKNAVEEYLAENPVEVDMTGYATEEYVNENLDALATETKGYVDENIEGLATAVETYIEGTVLPGVAEGLQLAFNRADKAEDKAFENEAKIESLEASLEFDIESLIKRVAALEARVTELEALPVAEEEVY